MKSLLEAIQELSYPSKQFPKEAIQVVEATPETAKIYLYQAIHKVIQKPDMIEDGYMLHFYAIFLLAEFEDTNSFEKIMELVSLPGEIIDFLLGDALTEGLSQILYHTYDGNLAMLKNAIRDPDVYELVKIAMFDVIGQLYLDGKLSDIEWKFFLREIIYGKEEMGECVCTFMIRNICISHFVDMLPDIRYLFQTNKVDETMFGHYDACLDLMFQYDETEFCKSPVHVEDMISHWSMFEQNTPEKSEEDLKNLFSTITSEINQTIVNKQKIGRNSPCPCGSGKKYKYCCLNKSTGEDTFIESKSEQQKWLRDYPETGQTREVGRIYLDDYFDEESIEIDKLLYLALFPRTSPFDQKDDRTTLLRKEAYLWEAFLKFSQKVVKEDIKYYGAYDKKYTIHYNCLEWLPLLEQLLTDNEKKDKLDLVSRHINQYQ